MAKGKQKAIDPDEVLPPVDKELQQQVAFVRECHQAFEQNARLLAQNAVMCGAALLHIRAQFKRGEWLPFFDDNVAYDGFGIRHAQRYMKVAKRAVDLLPTRSAKLLTNGKTTDKAALGKAMDKVTKATTWSELLADLFDKPAPKKTGGANQLNKWLAEHYPDHVGTSVDNLPPDVHVAWQEFLDGRRLSDEERLELEREHAAHTWQHLMADLDEWGIREKTYGMLPHPHREALAGLFDELAKGIRKTIARPPRKRTTKKGSKKS